MRTVLILAAVLAVVLLAGCASSAVPTQTYAVGPNGAAVPTVRAALDPNEGPGPMELFAFTTGPLLKPFQIKGGLTYDGSGPIVIGPSRAGYAAASGCAPQAQADPCAPQEYVWRPGPAQTYAVPQPPQYVTQPTIQPFRLVPAGPPQVAPSQAAPCE